MLSFGGLCSVPPRICVKRVVVQNFLCTGEAQFRLADLNWLMAVSKSFLILRTYHVFDLLMSWYRVLHFDSTVGNLELVCHVMAN